MPACIFCSIASGEVAASIVYESEHSLAFLDHRPVFKGHTLLIPRAHVVTLLDLPEHDLAPYFGAARMLARVVQESLEADGTFVAMNNTVSQSVPHLHVHIVPRRRKDGLRGFFWPRTSYGGPEELESFRGRIAAGVERLATQGNT